MPVTPIKLPITKGSDVERDLKMYLQGKVRSIRQGLRDIHETRVVKWRRAYEAKPAQETRTWPFENASNLVVPIIAIHTDELLARVMAAIFKTKPLWVSRVLGDQENPQLQGAREALEEFLGYVGIEPEELDLYRVYKEWGHEVIKAGTSVIKIPYMEDIEDMVVPGDGSGSYHYLRTSTYKGPRPEKVPFQNFGISPSAKTVKGADFKYHLVKLHKEDLLERRMLGVYDRDSVNFIIERGPDRTHPDTVENAEQQDAGAIETGMYGFAEWDIYECYFKYRWDNHLCRIIVWYHETSNTILRAYFNYYPCEIFVAGRLFPRDDSFHGYGFAEMLDGIQEEASTIHNQRRDNWTISNASVFRASPDSKVHEGLKIFPGAIIPGEKDELEALPMGTPNQTEISEEQMSMDLGQRRSGVSPPVTGAGAGGPGKGGKGFGAMGTLSVIQEGNTRSDLNTTDIRYAHTEVGRVVCHLYSAFGLDGRDKLFGSMGEKIEAAFDAFKKKNIALPIYAATASVNREVEKQNDLLLANLTRQHYAAIAQVMTQLVNPMMPPEVKGYLTSAIKASNLLMRSVMRHFGYDEVERLVPEPQVPGGTPPAGGPNEGPGVLAAPQGGPEGQGLPNGSPSGGPASFLEDVLARTQGNGGVQ